MRELSPWLYELVQNLAGAKIGRRRLGRLVATVEGRSIVDLGGGTGWSIEYYRDQDVGGTTSFLMLDVDARRVADFQRRHPGARAIQADASHVPLASAGFDVVQFFQIAHHLDDAGLRRAIAECRRILRPGGTLIFCDPVWRPAWLPGRLLWLGDRGAYPRRGETLLDALGQEFELERVEWFTMLHHYLLATARPKA